MKSPEKFQLAPLIILLAFACSPFGKVDYNYDRTIDFTLYKTFAWVPDSTMLGEEEIGEQGYDKNIVLNNSKNYINHNLSQRGLLVNIDSPDVVLQLIILNEELERVVSNPYPPYTGYYFYNPYYFPYYYPRYRFYTWYSWPNPPFWNYDDTERTVTYIKGNITLNLFDTRLKKLVWTASSEGNIYDPEYFHYPVHPALGKILDKFPVKPIHKQNSMEKSTYPFRNNGWNRDIIDPLYPR
ncbi:DUF4136 domain-containing protein [Cyclobacterium plantarum]|uniref:DUF4136 domain-containing protein n=1 Tax=Cyclobacterium plantarum TaxID=2716263 RepID=A0ABX0HFB1_9BACT|nr:DUF4136 domain-containing protein [Cyclobacterium plantarum]NHE58846.1 DUF4136 domain-containing protein [Cyclobacterium plantarum]